MPLINWEVNLILTWSSTCVLTDSIGAGKFVIPDTKRYVPVVTLSTQDNTKLLLKEKNNNWNKYQSDAKTYAQSRYLNHLVGPGFQGVNTLFVLSFENDDDKRSHSNFYLPRVEVKDYNVMIDGKKYFDQAINNDFKPYENIRRIATGPGDDYTTGFLLGDPYLKENYKMIAIDLSKQQALGADPRATQQINFTANLDRAGNTTMFSIFEARKETVFDFLQGTSKVL